MRTDQPRSPSRGVRPVKRKHCPSSCLSLLTTSPAMWQMKIVVVFLINGRLHPSRRSGAREDDHLAAREWLLQDDISVPLLHAITQDDRSQYGHDRHQSCIQIQREGLSRCQYRRFCQEHPKHFIRSRECDQPNKKHGRGRYPEIVGLPHLDQHRCSDTQGQCSQQLIRRSEPRPDGRNTSSSNQVCPGSNHKAATHDDPWPPVNLPKRRIHSPGHLLNEIARHPCASINGRQDEQRLEQEGELV